MTLLYKLTAADGTTHGNTKWGPGVTHSGTGEGELCGPGWIHAYTHPLLAVLLNSRHADFANPLLWEAEGEVGQTDCGLKVGCKTLTTVREIPLPAITREQRIRFGILCAKQVCKDTRWSAWVDKWLSGEDRSKASAAAAAYAAAAAAAYAAAASAAAAAAAYAAYAAADAYAAAAAASAASAAYAAADAYAAAAAAAASAAADAYAANALAALAIDAAYAKPIDLIAIAEEACQ